MTVEKPTLICDRDMVWVEVGDRAYPLNGFAKTHLARQHPSLNIYELEDIWRIAPQYYEYEKQAKEADPNYVPES